MASFEFYAMTYHGNKLPADLFDIWESRAEDIVSFFERDYTVTATQEQRDKAICAIAEAAYMNDKAASAAFQGLSGDGGIVSSKSIGSVSVSYRQSTAAEAGVTLSETGQRKQYYDILRRYAEVYRGVRR